METKVADALSRAKPAGRLADQFEPAPSDDQPGPKNKL
jgi:hypothetical protein